MALLKSCKQKREILVSRLVWDIFGAIVEQKKDSIMAKKIRVISIYNQLKPKQKKDIIAKAMALKVINGIRSSIARANMPSLQYYCKNTVGVIIEDRELERFLGANCRAQAMSLQQQSRMSQPEKAALFGGRMSKSA